MLKSIIGRILSIIGRGLQATSVMIMFIAINDSDSQWRSLGRACRAQALPSACCMLPLRLQKDRDTLIEESNILLKRSICHANLPRLATPPQIVKVR